MRPPIIISHMVSRRRQTHLAGHRMQTQRQRSRPSRPSQIGHPDPQSKLLRVILKRRPPSSKTGAFSAGIIFLSYAENVLPGQLLLSANRGLRDQCAKLGFPLNIPPSAEGGRTARNRAHHQTKRFPPKERKAVPVKRGTTRHGTHTHQTSLGAHARNSF